MCHVPTYWFLSSSKLATPSSICPFFCPTVASNFYSSWDEGLPNLWALFAAAGIKSQKFKYANALASLPKQVLRDIFDTLDVCNNSEEPCPKWSLLIVGCNLLPTFGLNFAKCLTFHISKQQLITLSRTAQSRTCFAHAPPRQHGLRAQPREDTGLSPAEAVFGAQIVLPN